MFFEAIFTICMTNPKFPEITRCRIMVTEMSQTARNHTQCLEQAQKMLVGVGRSARQQFPKLEFHGEAAYCGSSAEYTGAITGLIKTGYQNHGYMYSEARF